MKIHGEIFIFSKECAKCSFYKKSIISKDNAKSLPKNAQKMSKVLICTPKLFLILNTPQSCQKGQQKSSQGFSSYVAALWCIFMQQGGKSCCKTLHLFEPTFCDIWNKGWHVNATFFSLSSSHLFCGEAFSEFQILNIIQLNNG